MKENTSNEKQNEQSCKTDVGKSALKFEYGFNSVNGIVKKQYYLHEIPNIKEKCDVWNVLPIAYVRQSIGHKDKNGKEIFVGDIIKAKTVDVIHPQDAFKIKDEYLTSSVYWDNYNCSFETDFNCFSFSDSNHFEIIGNIYESTQTTS